jgi:molybdate transport system substrate-binding protein
LSTPRIISPARRYPSLAAVLLAIFTFLTACASPAPVAPTGTTAPAAAPVAATAQPTSAPAAASASAAIKGELTVFAAASLADAFKEIGTELEKANAGAKVTYQFAGSPALRTQLQQGARADIFASADEPNMQNAQKDGTIAGEPKIFAQNKLVIITPLQTKIDVTKPQDLTKSGLKLVIGQKDLPAGNYARQIFDKMSKDPAYGADFATKALANVVSEEANVKQIASKVQLGEADAGIVYSTDVTAAVRSHVKIVEIPATFNVIARYPIALVKGGQNPDSAKAFIDYLVSPAGQAILEKNGFIRADAKP